MLSLGSATAATGYTNYETALDKTLHRFLPFSHALAEQLYFPIARLKANTPVVILGALAPENGGT
jgi:hypothetical protein